MELLLRLLRDGTLIVLTFGYAGIFLTMLVEGSGIPLPFPGTFLLAFVGYTVWTGRLGFVESTIAAAAGSTIGAWILYRIARDAGPRLIADHGHRLALTAEKVISAQSWFQVHSGRATFFARMTPGARIYISIAAGLARMNQALFLMATFAGTCLWSAAFILAAWALGRSWWSLSDMLAEAATPLLVIVAVIVGLAAFAGRRANQRNLKS